MRILAGDVGGTKTLLALVEADRKSLRIIEEKRFESPSCESLPKLVDRFLSAVRGGGLVDRACFGVAGPVAGKVIEGPNLPWPVDPRTLGDDIGIEGTTVINDFEAVAYGIEHLTPADVETLQEGEPERNGPIALVGAGTGLGEAFVLWDGVRYQVWPTEGGHADYAPRNALEFGLLLYFRERLRGRVSVERVLSGSGLVAIHDYLIERDIAPEDPTVREQMKEEDGAAVISRAALEGRSEACVRALDLFVDIYGSEAGNQGLRILATGGVYIGGGIAPKILEKLRDGRFLENFREKGRF